MAGYGCSAADLDRPMGSRGFLGLTGGTLRDLLDKLRLTYCHTVGVEYLEIAERDQRTWLQHRSGKLPHR
jgi:2-oxoglutarate dehydrogenase E1 component